MECTNHKNRIGNSTCGNCGNWLCSECVVEIRGRLYCHDCASTMQEYKGHVPPPPLPSPVGIRYEKRTHTNGFLFFVFSLMLPGINFMYLGMMKRGLFFLSSFFFIAFLLSSSGFSSLGFAIPILYITSFFDGFDKRRRLERGEHIVDDINDIKSFVSKYKSHILIGIVAIIAINLFSDFTYFVSRFTNFISRSFYNNIGLHPNDIFKILCVIAIGYGIYMIGKVRGSKHH